MVDWIEFYLGGFWRGCVGHWISRGVWERDGTDHFGYQEATKDSASSLFELQTRTRDSKVPGNIVRTLDFLNQRRTPLFALKELLDFAFNRRSGLPIP